jgi:hypothetical protein
MVNVRFNSKRTSGHRHEWSKSNDLHWFSIGSPALHNINIRLTLMMSASDNCTVMQRHLACHAHFQSAHRGPAFASDAQVVVMST